MIIKKDKAAYIFLSLCIILLLGINIVGASAWMGEWIKVADQLESQTQVRSMVVYNDTIYGGTYPNSLLFEWNGTSWIKVADQLESQTHILSMVVYNNTIYGGTYPNNLLFEWNGTSWIKVADQLESQTDIFSMVVYNNTIYGGTGLAGLLFEWNGTSWIKVADQLESQTQVRSMVVYNNTIYGGTGPAGLLFEWNGTSWIKVADQLESQTHILSMVVYNNTIYGGTGPAGLLFEWNGTSWIKVADQLESQTHILSMVVYNNTIYGGTYPNGLLFEWNGTSWIKVADQLESQTHIFSMVVYNNTIYGGTYPNGLLFEWGLPITITKIYQNPSELYQNSTGIFNVTFLIKHPINSLNRSSINYTYQLRNTIYNTSNWSLRVPSNNRSVLYNGEYILRADNMNDTLNFVLDNVYEWGGGDENASRMYIEPINGTHTLVHWNGTLRDTVFSNMWYLDRTELENASKTVQPINKDNDFIVKIWDIEAGEEHEDYILNAFFDTPSFVGELPNKPLLVYYCNESFNVSGNVDLEDSPYCFMTNVHNASTWLNHIYTPRPNSSYIIGLITNESVISSHGINVSLHGYIGVTAEVVDGKSYYINVTADETSTNRSFAETNVSYYGPGAPYAELLKTPNIFVSQRHEGHQFRQQLCILNVSNVLFCSGIDATNINFSYFPPTKPSIDHFHFPGPGDIDYNMNGTYNGTFTIGVGLSNDPDGGDVLHNLTLHYSDGGFAVIINDSFYQNATTHNNFADIEFYSTPFYFIGYYTLRIIAMDDEGISETTWLDTNFQLLPFAPTPTPTPTPITNVSVIFEIEEGSNLYVGILLILSIIFLLIGLRLPLFFILAWFVAWYGGYHALNNTTEGMIIILYFLLGIFALLSFGLHMIRGGEK